MAPSVLLTVVDLVSGLFRLMCVMARLLVWYVFRMNAAVAATGAGMQNVLAVIAWRAPMPAGASAHEHAGVTRLYNARCGAAGRRRFES